MAALLRYAAVFAVGLGAGALVMAQSGGAGGDQEAMEPTGRAAHASPAALSGGPTVTEDLAPLDADAPGRLDQIVTQLRAEQAARQQLSAEVSRIKDDLIALRRDMLASAAPVLSDSDDPGLMAPQDATHAEPSTDPAQGMIALGVSPQTAADVKRRVDKVDLERLMLRDRAAREGWLGNEEYFKELAKVDGSIDSLREELGDDTYDKFLYSMGQTNRVLVQSVIDGSPAAVADIRPNDTVLSYGGTRIFSWDELRQATTEGAAGEYVPVTVLRDGTEMELLLPRGPLGVKLDAARQRPE